MIKSTLLAHLPKHYNGFKTNVSSTKVLESSADAHACFEKAKSRLIDVNNWQNFSDNRLSAKFELADETGKKLFRSLQVNDYFKIDVPFPGLKAGDGHDWVQVKEIFESNGNPNEALFLINVQPAPNPHAKTGDDDRQTSHFFDNGASSTFSIVRKDLTVTALILGRSEKPNTFVAGVTAKIRNLLATLGSFFGFSYVQWKSLAKGILKRC